MFGESTHRVHVCFGPNCTPRGSRETFAAFQQALVEAGLSGSVELIATSCRNRCELGPSVNVYPGFVTYGHVGPDEVERIVREHLAGGQVVQELVVTEAEARKKGRR